AEGGGDGGCAEDDAATLSGFSWGPAGGSVSGGGIGAAALGGTSKVYGSGGGAAGAPCSAGARAAPAGGAAARGRWQGQATAAGAADTTAPATRPLSAAIRRTRALVAGSTWSMVDTSSRSAGSSARGASLAERIITGAGKALPL